MSITPIFLSDVDSLETGEQNKVAEPVSLTRQSLDEGGIAVAVRVGAELEKAKKRIEELEGERDAANMAAEKASETSRVALEETENALAQLTEAQNLRQDANAAFQAMREAGLMAGTRPVTLSNLTAKMIARMAELEVQLGEEKVYHERWYRGAVELTNKVEVLQAQLTEARNKTATLESQLSIYVANRAAVQAAIEKAEGEKREAEQKLAGETELVRKLNGDLSVADASIADMKAQMAEWKAAAAAENTKLLRQREQAEVRVKELERELGRAKDETALVTVHLEKREELLNQLAWGRREETLLVENADLRREAREAKERAEKFEARAAAALGEREVMEAQLTEAKGLLSAAEAELEKYKREHASLNEQLDRAIDNGITDTEEEKARRLAAEARRDNRAHELGEAWRAELNRADKAEARAERLEGDKQRLDFLSCHMTQINLDYRRPKGEAYLYSGKKTLRELIDIEMAKREESNAL